jgi:hypothetical protein
MYISEELFQLVMSISFDQSMLVVDVLDDEIVVVLGVDLDEDGFDGLIALN